jgi:hypothetical protein
LGIGENKRQDRKEGGIKVYKSSTSDMSGNEIQARARWLDLSKPSFHRKGSGACSLGVIYRVVLIPPRNDE